MDNVKQALAAVLVACNKGNYAVAKSQIDTIRDHIAALQSRIDALTADAAESERQLALYRKAINRMDDMTEYARPGLTREQLRVIFADLTAGLARQQEAARAE